MASGPIAGQLPGVIEDQSRRGGGDTPREHTDLVRVGSGVEVATDHYWVAPAGRLRDQLGELSHLSLTHPAGGERGVQHHDEELNEAPLTLDARAEHFANSGSILSSQ